MSLIQTSLYQTRWMILQIEMCQSFCSYVCLYVLSGPATVRMVSNNGPPLPMPMHVPPGHMVQQIVDENGILTHVILSPQPHNVMGSPMTVGFYVCIMDFPFCPAATV